MKFVAVIVNYNSSADAERCVYSLVSAGAEEVVLVDNGSKPEEANMLRQVAGVAPHVKVHYLGQNLGFGAGVNRAVSLLEDQELPIWIVNPDVVVTREAGAQLAAALHERRADLVSPTIRWGDASEAWFSGGHVDLRRGATYHHDNDDLAGDEIPFLTGAALMVTRQAWTTLTGFREDFFLYWEDADLCLRAYREHLKADTVKVAEVWHRVGGSGDSVGRSSAYHYYMARNRLLVCAEPANRWRLVIGVGAPIFLRQLYWAFREKRRPILKITAVLRGVRDGLLGRVGFTELR